MGGANHLAQFFSTLTLRLLTRRNLKIKRYPKIHKMPATFLIRDYCPEDFDAVTILWRVARERSLPEFQRLKGYFFYEDQAFFRDHILSNDRVWVVEMGERPVAFMAMKDDFIDHLYVHPDYQGQGIGKALLDFARQLSPEHVWLYTLQVNIMACRFYEKNGFVAEKFGISPAPESEPDVEYHWRKAHTER